MKLIHALVLSVLATSAAEAAVYTYKFDGYPKGAGNCHEAALSLAEKWAQATGTKVLNGRCEEVYEEGYLITVRYEAEKAIHPVSTTDPFMALLDERGLFKTAAQCEAALPGEVFHFRQATGIEPFVSYCYREKYTRTYPYALRIEGIGEARSFPRYTGVPTFGTAMGYSETTFLETVLRSLRERGVDARFASYQSSVAYGQVTVFYYSPTKQRLLGREVVKVRTQEQCTSAMAEMNGFLATHGAAPVISYCARQSIGGYFEVTLLNWGEEPHEYNQSIETYNSYEACQAGRPALVEYYRTKLKRPVIGALCALSSSQTNWAVMLFEERR